MKVEVNLNVTQQEFFDYLMQSLIIDIFKHTDEFYLKENIHPSFIYNKPIKDKNKTYESTVKIIELQEPNIYKSEITVGSNTNMISYEIIPNNEYIKVIYSEEMNSNKKLYEINYKVMSFLLKRKYQKKMKKMMMYMENHIQRSKE